MISLFDLFASSVWRYHALGIALFLGLIYLFSVARAAPDAQTSARQLVGNFLAYGSAAAVVVLLINVYRLFGVPGGISALTLGAILAGLLILLLPTSERNPQASELPVRTIKDGLLDGLLQEAKGDWDGAILTFRSAENLSAANNDLWSRPLAKIYSARILRNQGKTQNALSEIAKVTDMIESLPEDGRKHYLLMELRMVAGTIHQKLPLPADKKLALDFFERAVFSCKSVLLDLNSGDQSLSRFLEVDPRTIKEVATVNIGVGNINLAEMLLHEGLEGRDQADEIAGQILLNAEKYQDGKLAGGAYRIKGEIALQNSDPKIALEWFEKSLAAYSRSPTSQSAETLAAVQNHIQEICSGLARKEWEQNGSIEMFPELDKVPEQKVFQDHPSLLDLDARAESMPASEAWRLYFHAAKRWDDAGWRDRTYAYLKKTVAILDRLRENIPMKGSYLSERRTEFYGKNAQNPLFWLVDLLLSSDAKKISELKEPITEAFYYREKLGAVGLLEELEAGNSLLEPKPLNRSREIEFQEMLKCDVCRVEDVQACLPQNTYLIEYVFTNFLLSAFLVSKDNVSLPIYRELSAERGATISYQEIQAKILGFVNSLGDPTRAVGHIAGMPAFADIQQVKQQARELYDLLIAPLNIPWQSANSENPLKIIFVPQGEMHLLPFSALYDGSAFLTEKAVVSQMPIASLIRQDKKRDNDHNSFLYFGFANPESETALAFENVVLQAAKTFGLLGDWKSDQIANENKHIFCVRRLQATYSSILENIGKYRIVDLETHGVFYESNPLNSGFLIMEDNKTSKYLRARDIFLNIRMNAELLVAAMCNSGQVRLGTGDEMVGLLRAFMFAGCHNLLVYPWLLLDEGAELFLGNFYNQLAESMKKYPNRLAIGQAYQKAQIELIQRGRNGEAPKKAIEMNLTWEHPRFWAWTLTTDYPYN